MIIRESITLIIRLLCTPNEKKSKKNNEFNRSSTSVSLKTPIFLTSLILVSLSFLCNILSSNLMIFSFQDFQRCLNKLWKSWTQTLLEFQRSLLTRRMKKRKVDLLKSQSRQSSKLGTGGMMILGLATLKFT